MTIPEPTVDPVREHAIVDLRRLVETEDPVYKPARFLLATRLVDLGDGAAASPLFRELMRPVEERAVEILQHIKENWKTRGPRFVWLRRLPFVKTRVLPWLELYRQIFAALSGGRMYLYAKWWSELRDLLDKPAEESLIDDRESAEKFRAALIAVQVSLFSHVPAIQKYIEIAAGKPDDKTTAAKAREILDRVLDQQELWQFAHELQVLDSEVTIQRLAENFPKAGITSKADESSLRTHVAVLREHPIAVLYEHALDRLEFAVTSRRWDEVEQISEELQLDTREPSEYTEAQLLQQAMVTPPDSWVSMFLPAFALLDGWRATFRNSLYLESAYGRYLADYLRGDADGLKIAFEGAANLAKRLEGARHVWRDRARATELHTLALCLASDAMIRYTMSGATDDSADFSVQRHLGLDLTTLAKRLNRRRTKASSADEAAAAARSLGLLARFSTKRRAAEPDLKLELDEIAYFEHAREALDAAETNFCLAESLMGRGDATSAAAFLTRALAQAPRHARALALAATMNTA
jgi:hypothetical protein